MTETVAYPPGWSPPVAVALVGCGAVAREYYAPALRRLHARGWVGSVRLFDPAPGRAARLAAGLPASTVAERWDALLDARDELAIVASPPTAHAEQAHELLEHGKHVLCEKPLTLDPASAAEVVRHADECGRFCAAAMVRRFSRSARFLRALLCGRGSSPVRRLTWHEGTVFRWPVASTDYFTGDPGARLLWDMGSHVLDLLVWWLGAPDSLTCQDDAMGGVEANCLLEFEYRAGPRGHIRLSRDCELAQGLVVERADDVVRCPDLYSDELVWAPRNPRHVVRGRLETGCDRSLGPAESDSPVEFVDCFVAQLENVLDSVRGAADLWVPARGVVESIRCLAAADANRAALELPWLSPRERERAQALHVSAVEVAG